MPATSRRHVVLWSIAFALAMCDVAVMRAAAQQLAPLANPVVNATDTTEHDTQSTTAIVLGSGSTVIAAFADSALDNGTNQHFTGFSRSTNGGASWTDGGTLPTSTLGDGGPPSLARDQTSGQVYMSTPTYVAGSSAIQVFRSVTDGASWLSPVNAAPGFTGGDFLGLPKIAVDNFPGTGQGYVYATARNVAGGGPGSQVTGIYLSRSIDGGATFTMSPFGVLSTGGTGPYVVVGKDHAVYVFWWINLTPPQIRFRKSTDLGVTFGPITTAAFLTGAGDLGLGFGTNSFPQAAVNPVTGDLYVTFNDKGAGADKADIFAKVSSDGGMTWHGGGAPVNKDGPYLANRDQFMPTMAITPDGRHGLITWYDRRSDPADSLIERWGVTVTIMGPFATGTVTLGPNFRISTGSWPVVIGQDTFVGPGYMGIYDAVAADNNFFYVLWGDNRLSNPATPLPHPNQPDVRFGKIPVTGPPIYDTDRDLQTDRTIFRPSTGVWYTALSGNGGATATPWGTSSDIDVMADYDYDGKADVAVFRPSTGTWYIVQSSNGAIRTVAWGTNGDIPIAADVDGDGAADLVVFRPSTGTWYINLSTGGTLSGAWGTNGDIPLLADLTGDGIKELVIYRPSTGIWYVLDLTNGQATTTAWGTSGDIPVVGDYDGDGIADVTVFRPSTGQWFVRKSSGGTLAVTWGTSADVPVSGDWDGDGKSDFTVWRPSTGTWYTQFAAGGTAAVSWGTAGDKPTGRVPGS